MRHVDQPAHAARREASDDGGGALLFYSLGAALLALSAFIMWYFPQH